MKSLCKKIALLLVAALALLYFLFPLASVSVFAAAVGSDVLDDLQTDEGFDASKYEYSAKDYSLHVIQVAESTNGELLVYVYQPSGERADVRASSINIARERTDSVGLGFRNYALSFCNSSGVFFKYKVEDFELEKSALRYYNISNILRPFSKDLGDKLDNDNKAKDVPYAVGQFWTACTVNDEVTYSMTETEVIEISDKYVGYVRYMDGHDFGWKICAEATDSHFVAFSTDKRMDKLLSASVEYTTQAVDAKFCVNSVHTGHKYKDFYNVQLGDPETVPKLDLTYDETGSNEGSGQYDKYVWHRIERTEDFLESADNENYKITKNGKESMDKTQWVLRFKETEIQAQMNNGLWAGFISPWLMLLQGDAAVRWTQVSDVMILQLGFQTDGHYYNLGAVDNHQTGSGFSFATFVGNHSNWWKIVLAVIAVLVVLILLYFVLKLFLFRNKTVVNVVTDKGSTSAPKKKKKKTGGAAKKKRR